MRVPFLSGAATLALVAALAGLMIARQAAANPVAATISLSQGFSALPVGNHSGRAMLLEWVTGRSHLLDLASGRLRAPMQVTPAGDSIATTGFDTEMRRLYVVSMASTGSPPFPGHVCALDTRSGRLRYCSAVTLGGPLGEVVASAQRVYVLTLPVYLSSNTAAATRPFVQLTILNAVGGRVVRIVRLPAPRLTLAARDYASIRPPLAVDPHGQRLYVSALDHDGLSIFDALSGRLLRTISLSRVAPTGADPLGATIFAAAHLSRVYVVDTGQAGATFITLDAASGRVLGAVPLGRYASLPVFDAPTHRWLALDSTRGRLIILDDRSGRRVATARVDSGSLSSIPELIPDERSGRVALLNPRGRSVGILDGRSGRTLRTVYLGGSLLNLGIDEQHGHILVTDNGPLNSAQQPTGNGSVRVIDERTGKLLNTVMVGRAPYIITVDSHAERALIFNVEGSATMRPDPWAWAPSWLLRVLPFLPPPTATRRAQTPVPTLTLLDTSRL